MVKYLTIAFNTNLLLTFFGYLLGNEYITYTGYNLVTLILFVTYGTLRKWKLNKIDGIMYIAFLLSLLSDLITYRTFGDWGIIMQTTFSLISNFLFFYIFRLQSSFIIISNRRDFWRFVISLIPFILFFGIIFFSDIKDPNLYLLTGFYIIFSYLSILNVLYLSVGAKSKSLALLGFIFRMFSDAIYSVVVFLHISNMPILFTNFLFYAYSYYFIVLSVLTSDSKFMGNSNDYFKTFPKPLNNILDRFGYLTQKL